MDQNLNQIFQQAALNRKWQKKANLLKQKIKERIEGKILPKHDEHGHHYQFTENGLIVDSVTTILGLIEKEHIRYWAVKKGLEWLVQGDRMARLKLPDGSLDREILTGAQFAHRDERDAAGSTGHDAHDAAERYIKEWIETGTRPKDIRTFFEHEKGKQVFGYYLPDVDITLKGSVDLRAIAAARAVERMCTEMNIIPIASEILVGDPRYSAGTLDFLALLDGEVTLLDFKSSNFVDDVSYPLQVSAYAKFLQKMAGVKTKSLRIMKLSKDYAKFEDWIIPDIEGAYKAFKSLATFYHSWYAKGKDERIRRNKESIIIK